MRVKNFTYFKKLTKAEGFIQIPLLIAIIFSIAAVSVGGYGGFEHYRTSKVIKEAEQFTKKEKYDEAIDKLEVAENKWFTKNLGIKKQKIAAQIEKNERNLEDKLKFTQALEKIDERNYQEAIDSFSEISKNSLYYKDAQVRIEEAKRKMVEGELGEVKIAKKEAEQKAQEEAARRAQEQLEKEIAEQQLSEERAEERRLSADKDEDGLTVREEENMGTSDLTTDSDGDGIDDNEDANPAEGGRYQAQAFNWSYKGYNWTWKASIHEDWYTYYRSKKERDHPSTRFLTPNDDFIQRASRKIEEAVEKKGFRCKSCLAISFVQSLSYVEDVFTGYDEYPKYPVETFFEKNGDCEDMTYLASSLLGEMDIGNIILIFPGSPGEQGHMALGVWTGCDTPGTYYRLNGRCYYYAETTSSGWPIGAVPPDLQGREATLMNRYSGATYQREPRYVAPCEASSDFPGYYYSEGNYYSDSNCTNLATCLPYEDYYFKPTTESFYWDRHCNQIITPGCEKSTEHPGYFFNGVEYYHDSQCTNKARVCRSSSLAYDKYYDGYDFYWDSGCNKQVVPGCDKSAYHPGYFFDGVDYYSDYQCTQEVSPY